MLYLPKAYKKNIFDIDYKKLKKTGIKCLIFDLDNTIVLIDQKDITDEIKNLLTKLKEDFEIIIISNNTTKRVKIYANMLKCDYVANAMKPLSIGYRKIKKKYNLKNNEMCMIGDQLITDVLGGNRFKIYTILVEPLGKKDLKITSVNRFIERIIFKKYERKHIMKKGEYYG